MLKLFGLLLSLLFTLFLPLSCSIRPETPIEDAAFRGDLGSLKALIASGANVNVRNRRGQTPLMFAARNGNLEAIRILAGAGARLDVTDTQNGWTALQHAVHKHQFAVARLLLDLGEDVNQAGRGGYTPLMMAAGYGDTRMVRLFLEAGANPFAETTDGVTALSDAVGGVPDMDRFTLGSCQTETVKALLDNAPRLTLLHNGSGRRARLFAKAGRCRDVLALVH